MIDWINTVKELGAGEIFLNSIDGDGMKTGLDCNLIKEIRKNINLPFVAGGGVGSVEHILDLIELGCNGVAIGNILHFDCLSINEIKLKIKQSNDCVRVND